MHSSPHSAPWKTPCAKHPWSLIHGHRGRQDLHGVQFYCLIKFAGARWVLFLVDPGILGRQALKELQAFRTSDDGRIFTELYNVQHLQSSRIDPVAKACISTIQRLYSMLKDEELNSELDELLGASLEMLQRPPDPIAYNPAIPIETLTS